MEDLYWTFVCNPRKWAIDRFLARRIERDSWGVRPSDQNRFAPGQLGVIRVGVDRRTREEREGCPPLEAGFYALVEVESATYSGTGASDEFWAPGEARKPGWPTVDLRYLRTYQDRPLTIRRLHKERLRISQLLLRGFQGSTFPISGGDFRTIMALLGENIDDLPSPPEQSGVALDKIAAIEKRYLHASPEVKERFSRSVERGPIGALVKQATGFSCQLCKALGLNPVGFIKPDGQPYVEAHHVMPLSRREVGSLSASNVMILCANHHRQMHHGGIVVTISATAFHFRIEGTRVSIPKLCITTSTAK